MYTDIETYIHIYIGIYIYIYIYISGAWAAVRVSVLQGKIASVLCDY